MPLDGKNEVVIRRATRNKAQNALYHAALSDIAEQLSWPRPPRNGQLRDLEWWKRRTTLGWLLEEKVGAEVIEDLFEEKFGILIPHTSDLDKDDMAALCEWTFALGSSNGVKFKDPKQQDAPPDEAYEGYR